MQIVAYTIVGIILLLFVRFFFIGHSDNESFANKTPLFGDFFIANDHVYINVPGDGPHLLPDVDRESFGPISNEYQDRHIAKDKNHVYCGDRILPGMNPTTCNSLGNNYYSDGSSTFYCFAHPSKDTSISSWSQSWKEIKHELFNAPKPYLYTYRMQELPHSTSPYHSVLSYATATDGEQVYFFGLLMPDANPSSLKPMIEVSGERLSESIWYNTDGQYVYFKNKKLAIPYNSETYSLHPNFISGEYYLVDSSSGTAYQGDIRFDSTHLPYSPVSTHSAHAFQLLFESTDGIYFYNKTKNTIERAGNNPFLGSKFKEIAPLVFTDGSQSLIIDASSKWAHGGARNSGDRRHIYDATQIYRLDELPEGEWQKLGEVYRHTGSVWKKGNTIYYFDEMGEGQAINHTIYKIADEDTKRLLLDSPLNAADIRKLIVSDKLLPAEKTLLLEAKTKY